MTMIICILASIALFAPMALSTARAGETMALARGLR